MVGPGGGDFAPNPNRFGGGSSGSKKTKTRGKVDKNLLDDMFGLSIKKKTKSVKKKPTKTEQISAIKAELKKKKPSDPPAILKAKLKILEGK